MLLKKIKTSGHIFMILGLICLFFYPALFSEKTFFFRDIHRWFYPMKYFLAASLKRGALPFWCPNYFCGSPFMSDIQSGVFYPPSLLLIMFPFPFSFNVYILFHFFLGFSFFYLFIRELGLSKPGAMITGISFCFGGYIISSVNVLNNLSTAVWLPAVLWSFQRSVNRKEKSGYLLTLFFLCMAILGGEPELFLMIAGVLFLYSMTQPSPEGPPVRATLKMGLVLLGLLVSAGLMTAVQLGPTYGEYQYSARLGGLTYQEVTRFSLGWGMVKHLILPLHFRADFATDPSSLKGFFPGNGNMPWLLTVYPGMLILPLALLGLYSRFSKKFLLWPLLFLLALALALGKHTPIYHVFYEIFPFFRFPEKFMFLAGFSLLVMAAYGFDRLMALLKALGIRPLLPGILLIMALVLDLYSAHANLNPLVRTSFYRYHSPALAPVLKDRSTFRIYVDQESDLPVSARNTIFNHHILWQMLMMPNLGILDRRFQVGGKTGLELRYQYLLTEILSKPWSQKMRFLRLANVKYIISSRDLAQQPGLRGKLEKVSPLVYRIRDPLPRAWLVGRIHPLARGTVETLLQGSLDPARSAYGPPSIAKKHTRPFFQRVETVEYDGGGRIHITLTAHEPSVLVLSESSYPGWRVYVDGKERQCLWLDLLFQGVEVGQGKHNIRFVFRPKDFSLFLGITMVSVCLFLFAWFCTWLSGRRRHQAKFPAS